MRTPLRLASALLLLAGCTSAPAAPAAETKLSLEARREIFLAAWTRIAEKHPDPKLGGVDWDAVRAKYAPEVDAAKSRGELAQVLNRMVGELKHSHVAVLPPLESRSGGSGRLGRIARGAPSSAPADTEEGASMRGVVGLRVTYVDDAVIVTAVEAESPAAKAGIRVGDEIRAIDGEEVSELRHVLGELNVPRWQGLVPYAVSAMLSGSVGSTVDVDLTSAAGKPSRVTLERARSSVPPVSFGFLGAMAADFESRTLDGNVLYVRFTPCFVQLQEKLEKALDAAGNPAGVILDLRGNPGGLGAVATGVSRLFLSQPVNLGVMRTRTDEIRFEVNPAEDAYGGPFVVLVDGGSGSTAEILAGGLQAVRRARIVGTQSMGAALPSTFEELPHGWRVQLAIADFHLSNGKSVEGPGVIPDVVVLPSRRDYAQGVDPYLAAAQRELAAAPTVASAKKDAAQSKAAVAAHVPLVVTDEAAAVMDKMVEARGGAEALRRPKSIREKGKFLLMGLEGSIDSLHAAPNKLRTEMNIPGVGEILSVYDGKIGWMKSAFTGLKELEGDELRQMSAEAPLEGIAAWRETLAKVEIVERKKDGERDCIVLRQVAQPGDAPPTTVYVDAESFLPYRTEATMKTSAGTVKASSELVRYETFGGIKHVVESRTKTSGAEFTTKIESVEYDVPVDDALFAKPMPKPKKAKAASAPG